MERFKASLNASITRVNLFKDTNFKLNAEAHDENNSHLNNIHSCLSECDYYTDSELNAMHGNIQSTSCISTLSINCRSISKNVENIECI